MKKKWKTKIATIVVISCILLIRSWLSVYGIMCGGCGGAHHEHHKHEERKESKATTEKMDIKEYFYSTTYTCPMHPEVQSENPGKCPKCSMKLEKKQVLMTYACPEKDCEYQKAKPGKCPHHDKELIKCEVKNHCPKCGSQVEESELIRPKKGDLKLRSAENDEVGKKVFCPVMKKEFVVSKKTKVVDYKNNSYYLCCGYCEKEITKNPQKYISICPKCGEQVNPKDLKRKPLKPTQQIETKEQKEKIIYTCPMCGGEFDKPGKCPKCGMDLIPKNK